MEVRFTQSARRHRIGRASARQVVATAEPTAVTTISGADAWLYVGLDERGATTGDHRLEVHPANGRRSYPLVIHVMPTQLRGDRP